MKNGVIFAVILTLAGWRPVLGYCPQTAMEAKQEAQQCVAPLAKILDHSTGVSPVGIRSFCQSSATGVVDCIEKLLGDCARENPETRRLIAQGIDLDAFRKSFKYFCNNTNVLIDNVDCIDGQASSLTSCVKAVYTKYVKKLKSLEQEAYDRGAAWLSDQIIQALCIFNGQAVDCYDSTLRGTCGDKVADVFVALIVAEKPPGCSGQPGQGVSIGEHVRLMTIVVLLVIGLI